MKFLFLVTSTLGNSTRNDHQAWRMSCFVRYEHLIHHKGAGLNRSLALSHFLRHFWSKPLGQPTSLYSSVNSGKKKSFNILPVTKMPADGGLWKAILASRLLRHGVNSRPVRLRLCCFTAKKKQKLLSCAVCRMDIWPIRLFRWTLWRDGDCFCGQGGRRCQLCASQSAGRKIWQQCQHHWPSPTVTAAAALFDPSTIYMMLQ